MNLTDTVTIDAPVDVVWQLTADVAGWPACTPTMTSVQRLDDGPLRVGSRARIKQPGQRPAIWTVTRVDPGREFSWQTVRMGLTMVGTHRLAATGAGCRNTLELQVTGLLAALLGWLIRPAARRSLRIENAGFKTQAERRTSTA
jgi:hypothetical protein